MHITNITQWPEGHIYVNSGGGRSVGTSRNHLMICPQGRCGCSAVTERDIKSSWSDFGVSPKAETCFSRLYMTGVSLREGSINLDKQVHMRPLQPQLHTTCLSAEGHRDVGDTREGCNI